MDAVTRALADQIAGALAPVGACSAAELRSRFSSLPRPSTGPAVYEVTEWKIPGPDGPMAARNYRPGPTPGPLVVFFHGGGWTIGDLDTHDATCRELANLSGAVVLSVDYRLAPEEPYPAALIDACAATQWAVGHGHELGAEPTRLGVAGISAGANLAAAVALAARDGRCPLPALQLLICPVLAADFDTGSYQEYAERYGMTRAHMRWFWQQYLAGADWRTEPLAAPLAAVGLSGLPRAHIITAEFDPLRDEGEAYAFELRRAGVPVTATRFGGMIHGFFDAWPVLPAAREAVGSASSAIRDALGS